LGLGFRVSGLCLALRDLGLRFESKV
jgi:hypothetical protein